MSSSKVGNLSTENESEYLFVCSETCFIHIDFFNEIKRGKNNITASAYNIFLRLNKMCINRRVKIFGIFFFLRENKLMCSLLVGQLRDPRVHVDKVLLDAVDVVGEPAVNFEIIYY